MTVVYPTGIAQPDQEALEGASDVLVEVLGPQSSEVVRPEWTVIRDHRGRTLYRLVIMDVITNESASTDFAPDELKNALHLRFRMYRLWGDLLQVRNDRQHEKVRMMSAQVFAEQGHSVATQTELIRDLALDVNSLKERVETLRGETAPVREITNKLAIIEHKLAEIAKTKETWGQRGWTIFMLVFSAFWSVVTGVLVGVVMHYLNSKK